MQLTPIEPNQIVNIPLSQIEPDPLQARRIFDETLLGELADDIRIRGVHQPIEIIPPKTGEERYRIKTGERRWRASKLAGKKHIPCKIAAPEKGADRKLSRLFDQIAENHQRAELNALDWSYTFKRMKDEFGMSIKEIADACAENGLKHMSRPHVSNLTRLTTLPEWAQDAIRDGRLTAAHGKHLFTAAKSEPVMAAIEQEITLLDRPEPGAPVLSVNQLQQAIYGQYRRKFFEADDLGGAYGEPAPKELIAAVQEKGKELGLFTLRNPYSGDTEYFINNDDESVKAYQAIVLEFDVNQAESESDGDEEEAAEGDENTTGDEEPEYITPAAAARRADSIQNPLWKSSGELTDFARQAQINNSIRKHVVNALLNGNLTANELACLGAWRAFNLYQSSVERDVNMERADAVSMESGEFEAAKAQLLEKHPELVNDGWPAWSQLDPHKVFNVLSITGEFVVEVVEDEFLVMLAKHCEITLHNYRADAHFFQSLNEPQFVTALEMVEATVPRPSEEMDFAERVEWLVQHAELFGLPDAIRDAWPAWLEEGEQS